jgi:erythromycin esterase
MTTTRPASLPTLLGLCILATACGGPAAPSRTRPPLPAPASGADRTAPLSAPVRGCLETVSGEPIPGALIALVPAGASRASAITRTERSGCFELTALPGDHGLTATAPGFEAIYASLPHLRSREPRPLPTTTMATAQHRVTGTVHTLDTGAAPTTPTRVRASRYSDEAGDIFYTDVRADGAFDLALPAGDYALAAEGPSIAAFPEKVTVNATTRITLQAISTRSIDTPLPARARPQLAALVRPLDSADPDADGSDLHALDAAIGSARAVALGEATHGTREFFRMKHRAIRHLVENLGFTIVAFESCWGDAETAQAFIARGQGTAHDALKSLGFGIWQTQEILQFLSWLRTHNARQPPDRQVRFYGIDMQSASHSLRALLQRLPRPDPTTSRFETELAFLLQRDAQQTFRSYPAPRRAQLLALARRLADRATSFDSDDRPRLRRHADLVLQTLEKYSASPMHDDDTRDRLLAANVEWILKNHPRERIAIWTHNVHASKDRFSTLTRPMGSHLAESLGDDYRAIALLFHEGAFQAYVPRHQTLALSEVTVGPARPGSLEHALAQTGHPYLLADLRALDDQPALHDLRRWLTGPRWIRQAGYAFTAEELMYEPASPSRMFNAILLVRQTSRATPLEHVEEH